jgi:exopolysaccharide production protein ExoZ
MPVIPTKLESIQVLRGIAALLVACVHLQAIEQKYGHEGAILPAWLSYGKISVDLFFVISGFVIATVTCGQFRSMRAARQFLFQRITRIYPPYWLYSTMVLVVWFYRPYMVNATQDNQVNILASFLLLPQELLPLLMVGWTLVHEMYFYLIIALLMPVVRESMFSAMLALWAVFVIFGHTYFMNNPSENYGPAIQLAFHPLTLEFIGGAIIALFIKGNIISKSYLIIGIGITGFLFAASWLHASDIVLDMNGWWRVLCFGLPSLLVVYGAASAEIGGKVRFPRIMRKIGDASYSIYLTHVLVLSAIGRVWAQIATPELINHVAALVTMILAVIITGLISYCWVEVPILNRIRVWNSQYQILVLNKS